MNHSVSVVNFSTLSNEEKIDLFQKNQDLLIKYHPKSEFVIRDIRDVGRKILQYYFDLIRKYKGKAAVHKDFLLFFHIMQISDFDDASEYGRKRMIGDFHEDGNCLFIEYIVGKASLENLTGLEDYFKDKNVKVISYVKHENIKVVQFDKYKKEILKARF